jgi:CSLREA domain-containing protein
MRSMRNPIAKLIPYCTLLVFGVMSGCGGSPVPCDADIVVTKTADTNDGVCSGADCSLREAVLRANTCPGAQTIRVPAGTYTLTRAGFSEDAGSTGDLDISDDVTIWGTLQTVVDGNRLDRIFDVQPGVSASISTMIIQHGRAEQGGGIRNRGTLNVNELTVQDNQALFGEGLSPTVDGGGIYSVGTGALGVYLSAIRENSAVNGGGIAVSVPAGGTQSVMISYSQVMDNAAEGDGGGVWLSEGADSTLVRFGASGNTAGGNGGGVYNGGALETTYADLESNSADASGGGMYNAAAGSAVSYMTSLYANESFGDGGGIYNLGMAHFYQSLLYENTATHGSGGGAYNGSGAGLRINNTTVSANIGIAGGGGIRNEDGNLQLMFATFYSNESEGINNSGSGEATMRNTIVDYNLDGECAGTPVDSLGYNIDWGGSCHLDEPSDLSFTNPMLEPLAAGTSYMSTHALQPGSPAIDSADPDRCDGVDQRGVIRPQGANCDRGAHENEAAGTASIGGIVWHDLCAVPEHGYPPTPPPGCSDPDGDGLFIDANGVFEAGEPGIPGVTLRLKSGTCAAGSDLMTAVTDVNGDFSFTGLAAGTYCVSVGALTDGNDLVLLPGGWTFPNRGADPQQTEVVLGAGEARTDVNFGWDYQYLPAMPDYLTPTPTPAPLTFGKPWVSTDKIFFYGPNSRGDCGPREIKFQIGISSSEGVANMNLFVRLKEQGSGGKTGTWSGGLPMAPIGNNQYVYTLLAEDIPGASTFGESWLQYQFVALDKAGKRIAASEVFWNVTFDRCEYTPGKK